MNDDVSTVLGLIFMFQFLDKRFCIIIMQILKFVKQ